jgi:hypothetical protein
VVLTRFSQTNGARNYSEKVSVDAVGSAGIRQVRSDGRAQRGAGCTFFATHIRFDRHDAALSVPIFEGQDDVPSSGTDRSDSRLRFSTGG